MWRSEQLVKQKYESEGWKVLRNGWPDFLCVRDGKMLAIEVKAGVWKNKLSKAQKQIHEALTVLGVPVIVVESMVTPKTKHNYAAIAKMIVGKPELTYKEIAIRFGCSHMTVNAAARVHDVKRKRGVKLGTVRRKPKPTNL